MTLETQVRHRFVLQKDYDYFMRMTPEELIDLQNKELNRLSKILPSGNKQKEVAESLNMLKNYTINVELPKLSMVLTLALEWEGECALDIEWAEVLEIRAMKGASKQEQNLLELLSTCNAYETFVDMIWDDIISMPQYLEYEEQVEQLVRKIDSLQDEYPDVEWWNLTPESIQNGNDGT